MKIGFDYWQVLSHFPDELKYMIKCFGSENTEMYVISAVGKNHTPESVVYAVQRMGYQFPAENIHAVVFDNPSQSPELKVAKAKELGLNIFLDDRDDVCRAMNKAGIMALRVTRKDNSTYDLGAERK